MAEINKILKKTLQKIQQKNLKKLQSHPINIINSIFLFLNFPILNYKKKIINTENTKYN